MKGRKGGGREGVGVVKDEEIKFVEIEASHTLGGVGRYYVQTYTLRYVSLTDLGILCQFGL